MKIPKEGDGVRFMDEHGEVRTARMVFVSGAYQEELANSQGSGRERDDT